MAASDLKLVRLLRDAIRAADIAGGKIGPPGSWFALQPNPFPAPTQTIEPKPRMAPRMVIHPTPRFEPRAVIGRCVQTVGCEANRAAPAAGCDGKSRSLGSPLPPPWRMPVWKSPIAPAAKVKIHIHRVDVHNKGSLIDFFL